MSFPDPSTIKRPHSSSGSSRLPATDSKMPITVKDYSWTETEREVLITLPLKGVKSSKTDIFSTDHYLKVNFPPYLFEVHLFAPVEEEQCTAKIGNGVIEFRLIKKEPGVWGKLASGKSEDKAFMVERRAEAIEHAHKTAAEIADQKAKKKREEEQYAIKQQMRLEEEDRERIEREKQEEREKAERELERWKEEKRKRAVKVEPKAQVVRSKPPPTTVATVKQSSSGDIWKKGKGKGPAPPPPRKGGSIQVTFTPRAFPTAARESKEAEEQEYLAKMAAARRIKPPENTEETINERNPEFLKDKGVEFFRAGNHEAALNAFSAGIQLNPNLPHLFSNRAACYLAMGENERCINDCCRALELFFPVVPSNYKSRTKVFVRRGTAYANVGSLDLAVQDYEAALKLSPSDENLKEDCARLKEALASSS